MSQNAWYFDKIYNAIFVRGALVLGRIFWKRGDEGTIDRFGPDGLSKASGDVFQMIKAAQTGLIYHYVWVMLAGVVFFLGWVLYQNNILGVLF